MISEEFDIKEITNKNYQQGLLKKINDLYITEEEIYKLGLYNISVNNIKNLKELMVILRSRLDEIDEDDIDMYEELSSLYDIFSERDYYINSNK